MSRAVIFDVDGTLVDSVDLHAAAWQEALRHFGHEVGLADLRAQIGKGGDQLLPVFLPAAELERRGEEIERYRGDLFRRDYLPRVTVFPAVRDLFLRLRADGQRIALASSASREDLEAYEKIADIADLLDEDAGKDDAARSKPHPDIFEAALARLAAVDRDRVLVVGDSPWDALAAGKAGLAAIGMLCGGFDPDSLRQAGCQALYRDPADLLARFEDSPLHRRPRPA
ncbi:MAG: HAD family hydrolase [Acidobacteriota bacterium]|nr:HAD family hydrolase [Acidobacteriota bacterium]